jgi:hypothetical protein
VQRAPIIDSHLAKLLREASARPMTEEARERQLVSLAYGNAKLENDQITRSMVEDAVRRSRPKR